MIKELLGAGDFVKNGDGVLQYKGFQSGYDLYARTSIVYGAEAGVPGFWNPGNLQDFNALTGSFTVNKGEVQVAGYLNYWKGWDFLAADQVINEMTGVSSVILNDSARLSFVNTPLNVAKGISGSFPGDVNRNLVLTKRFNAVNNLTVGGTEGGARTVVDTGLDDTYRIIVHIDNLNGQVNEAVGSVGILAGRGDVIKTGSDELRVLGAAERGLGRVVIADGALRLADSAGFAIATADSVNLVGNDLNDAYGMRGRAVSGDYRVVIDDPDLWRPSLVAREGAGSLVLESSQTIRNLQADYAFDAAPTDERKTLVSAMINARDRLYSDEPYVAGTGRGTVINIGSNRLTIVQERDGIYRGSIVGDGTIAVNIAANHRLGLILDTPMTANLEISGAGRLIANANGLGNRTVSVSGNLDIYQDTASTLIAGLKGSGTVTLTASAIFNNSLDGLDAEHDAQLNLDDQRGTLAIGRVQTGFTGSFIVLDGQTLQLGSASDGSLNDSLADAAGVVLAGGDLAAGGRIATLYVASGVQTLKRLEGDSNSRVDLGRGTLVLKSASFGGVMTGAGNLVADSGSGTFAIDASRANYSGATVVRSGTFTAVGGLTNSSGVVLKSGAVFDGTAADQTLGALFGESGSVVKIGARTLTVGMSASRLFLLNQEIAGGTPLSSNYLGTLTTATDLGGAPVTAFDTAGLGGVPADVADATRLFLQNIAGFDATTAATLAFAGDITGSGNLVKVSSDRLILTGSNSFTGSTSVQGGTLRANWNSLNATSGVSVAAGATFEINADAASGDGSFSRTVSGAGTLSKVGSGTVTLLGSLANFSGALNIAEGGFILGDSVTDLTLNGTLTNSGTLIKTGKNTLTLGGYSGTGSIDVRAGTLAITALPAFPSGLNVARDATFVGTVSGTLTSSTAVTTSGTGANNGVVRLVAGTGLPLLQAEADDLFSSVTLDLRGVTFDLNDTRQTLAGFSGDGVVLLNGGTLIFNPDAGVTTEFSGLIIGDGDPTEGGLVKNGGGTLVLSSAEASTWWTGAVIVNAGTLEATPESLGASSVVVNDTGTLALRNTNVAAPIYFSNTVTVNSGGTLAKSGAGEVVLANGIAGIALDATIAVNKGRLTTSDAGALDSVFSRVQVAAGATYQVDMTGDRVHGVGLNAVEGAGSLAVNGGFTLTLAGVQGYTGNTELLGGATLDLATNSISTLNGLAGVAGTTVRTTGALTLVQNTAGVFSGTFTPDTALTVQGSSAFAVSGDLAAAGLSSVTVDGGVLQVDAVNTTAVTNNGVLNIQSAGAADTYSGLVTGTGVVTKVGSGTLLINDPTGGPRFLQNTGGVTVAGGTLGGNFTTAGALVIGSGATLAPGNSPGTVNVNGNFNLAAGSTLAVEINAATSDKVVVNGAATLAGALNVSQDNTLGSAKAVGGQTFVLVSATGGITGAFSNASANGLVELAPAEQSATGIKRVHVGVVGADLVMTAVTGLRDVVGFSQHEGIDGLVALFDAGAAPAAVQAVVDASWGDSTTRLVNNLSPLGFASEYAMAQDGENQRQALLHDRLEQRRYDRGSPLSSEDAPWEAFVVGGATFVDNDAATDTATFDYRNFGGLAGLDRKVGDDLLLGVAAGYQSGKATIKDNGGKVDMDRAAGTLFMSSQLTKRWYFDLGATAGVGLYESKRNTALGVAEGDNIGYSAGLNAETGTVVVLSNSLHLTPYLAASYTHHEFGSISESGTAAALDVDSWSQDSLRVKIGTGLGWFVPLDWAKFKVGLDVAFAHEMLDTDSELDARFAAAGSPKFSTTAAALPQDAVSLSPSLGLQFDESTSATVSYTYEMGLDARSYQSVNFAIRKRF